MILSIEDNRIEMSCVEVAGTSDPQIMRHSLSSSKEERLVKDSGFTRVKDFWNFSALDTSHFDVVFMADDLWLPAICRA